MLMPRRKLGIYMMAQGVVVCGWGGGSWVCHAFHSNCKAGTHMQSTHDCATCSRRGAGLGTSTPTVPQSPCTFPKAVDAGCCCQLLRASRPKLHFRITSRGLTTTKHSGSRRVRRHQLLRVFGPGVRIADVHVQLRGLLTIASQSPGFRRHSLRQARQRAQLLLSGTARLTAALPSCHGAPAPLSPYGGDLSQPPRQS